MTIDKTKSYDFNVGENIRLWREFKGVKQLELAKSIGKSKSTISNIESGKEKANTNIVEDIAKALGLEPTQLYSSPQQQFTFNNCSNSNLGVNNSCQIIINIDKDSFEKFKTFFEKFNGKKSA